MYRVVLPVPLWRVPRYHGFLKTWLGFSVCFSWFPCLAHIVGGRLLFGFGFDRFLFVQVICFLFSMSWVVCVYLCLLWCVGCCFAVFCLIAAWFATVIFLLCFLASSLALVCACVRFELFSLVRHMSLCSVLCYFGCFVLFVFCVAVFWFYLACSLCPCVCVSFCLCFWCFTWEPAGREGTGNLGL